MKFEYFYAHLMCLILHLKNFCNEIQNEFSCHFHFIWVSKGKLFIKSRPNIYLKITHSYRAKITRLKGLIYAEH